MKRIKFSTGIFVGIITVLIPIIFAVSQNSTNPKSTNSGSRISSRAFQIWQKCHKSATENLSKSQQNQIQCLNENILKLINENLQKSASDESMPVNEIFSAFIDLRRTGKIQGDLRLLTPTAHYAGMLLADKKIPPPEAFKNCGNTFKVGCIHGYVMEAIDDLYQKNALGFLTFCDPYFANSQISKPQYDNCIHGLGHELAVKLAGPLEKILDQCSKIKTASPETIDACTSGVLMEYSKTGPLGLGSGHHSEKDPGYFDPPCATLSQKYQSVCYASIGAYHQYLPDDSASSSNSSATTTKSFAASYQFCQSIPEKYQARCTAAVSERELLAEGKTINPSP